MLENALYIVATPIGNLDDITIRAKTILSSVDFIAAEDTRHSGSLLSLLNIATKAPFIALHDHNERDRADFFLKHLSQGKSVALISDAGTPLISDPGYHLVKVVREAGIKIIPIPGACALITALSASGLPTDRFIFEGFLPAKSVARQKILEKLKTDQGTLIFYESPHRIQDTIMDCITVFGPEREAVIARELTKKFETIHHGSLAALKDKIEKNDNEKKGEFVLLIHGVEEIKLKSEAATDIPENVKTMLTILLSELTVKQAANLAAKISGINKRSLYHLALQIKPNL